MTWICPLCRHSVLNHKNGRCLVIVAMPLPKGMHGEVAKRHCGCTHINPLEPQQMSFGVAINTTGVYDPD